MGLLTWPVAAIVTATVTVAVIGTVMVMSMSMVIVMVMLILMVMVIHLSIMESHSPREIAFLSYSKPSSISIIKIQLPHTQPFPTPSHRTAGPHRYTSGRTTRRIVRRPPHSDRSPPYRWINSPSKPLFVTFRRSRSPLIGSPLPLHYNILGRTIRPIKRFERQIRARVVNKISLIFRGHSILFPWRLHLPIRTPLRSDRGRRTK